MSVHTISALTKINLDDAAKTNHTGAPEKFTPRRDVRIDSRVVVCPNCKAEIGEFCIWPSPTTAGYHPARRRMAVRLRNEELFG